MRSFVPSAALIVATLLGACNETFPAEQRPPVPVEDPLKVRPSNTTCVAPANPLGRIRLETAWEGFYRPVAMVDRPDLGLVYVAEMPGKVKVIDRASGAVTTAIDLVGKGAGSYFEQGLLGVAIHPTKPYAYVTLERDTDSSSRTDLFKYRAEIVRYTMIDGGRVFDPASETIVLRVDRPTELHYPGTLEFGPDGYLYIGIGDGGSYLVADFQRDYPSTLLGSIVRIDVDSKEPYAVPPDNPFVGDTSGVRPEIFARGFRNPWRFTFDRANGEIWAGDVGEITYEEVNKIEKGKHYGWPTVEGNDCFQPPIDCDKTGLTAPELAYHHAEGSSITGGYVYRGKAMPELVGKYVFGDFTIGRIWMLDGTSGDRRAVWLNSGGVKPSISSFGQDADGELYALDWMGGTIYRLAAGDPNPPPALPERLSQTGCVDRDDPTRPASGLVPYDVNVALWSDGADKKRFVALPDGKTLHVEEDGDLTLPEGGILVKEFSVAGKRIETRLLVHHPDGDWSGVTYEWNDAETDATRLDGAKTKVLANGQTWTFPSPAQCFVCHTKATKTLLGVESLQLNRDFDYAPGRRMNQLTKLSDIGYLDHPVDPSTTPALPQLTATVPVEDRARAYLHANCSGCHRPETGIAGGRIDFRFREPRTTLGLCVPATLRNVQEARIIMPGAPERSAVFLRMSDRADLQMPPLGTRVVDQPATALVEEWIRSLAPTECN